LLFTLLIEVPIVFAVLYRRAPVRFILTAAFFGNLVSHPLIHLVPPTLFPSREVFLAVVESGAVLIEALVLLLLARPRPWWLAPAASLAVNAASFFTWVWISGMPI
jgi:hypothetical protein